MKFLFKTGIVIVMLIAGYFAFIYYVSYSEGVRAGELVKSVTRP